MTPEVSHLQLRAPGRVASPAAPCARYPSPRGGAFFFLARASSPNPCGEGSGSPNVRHWWGAAGVRAHHATTSVRTRERRCAASSGLSSPGLAAIPPYRCNTGGRSATGPASPLPVLAMGGQGLRPLLGETASVCRALFVDGRVGCPDSSHRPVRQTTNLRYHVVGLTPDTGVRQRGRSRRVTHPWKGRMY